MRFVGEYLQAHGCKNWDENIDLMEFAYNRHLNSSIGMSPFEADLGYIPHTFVDLALPTQASSLEGEGLDHVQQLKSILDRARDHLIEAQIRMKTQWDKGRRPDVHFNIGDLVLLDTENLSLRHLRSSTRKMAPRFIGPYTVKKETTPDTYLLEEFQDMRIHPEFHVSRLKAYLKDPDETRWNPPPPLGTTEDLLLVEDLKETRSTKTGVQILVKWLGLPNPTWEPVEILRETIPSTVDEFLRTATPETIPEATTSNSPPTGPVQRPTASKSFADAVRTPAGPAPPPERLRLVPFSSPTLVPRSKHAQTASPIESIPTIVPRSKHAQTASPVESIPTRKSTRTKTPNKRFAN
jgi:hypothetical protein